jgi:hypothetical protein
MFRNRMVMMLVGSLVVLAASVAQADNTRGNGRAAPVTATSNDRGYGYEFTDDPLNAMMGGSNTATIIARPKAGHSLLIRPRMQFVSEMLKSVENI